MYNVLLGSFNMLHTVNFRTRFQNNHSSAIDNIFVNKSRLHLCSILPIYNGLSDHDAQCLILIVLFVFKKKKNNNNVRRTQNKTLHSRYKCYFQGSLLKETWEVIYQERDINEIFNNFFEKISQSF